MRVLVTGASRGLGRATVEALAWRGHQVLAAVRDPALAPHGPQVQALRLDVTDPDAVAAAAPALDDVDAVVNNAGVTLAGPVEAVPVAEVQALFEVNLFGALRMTQAVLPGMRSRRRGTILYVSSIAGRFAPPLHGAYAASKAALDLHAAALGFELRPFAIDVVSVAAGAIRTGAAGRERWFEHPAYAPLVRQVRTRLAAWQGGLTPEAAARRIAEQLEVPHPRARVVLARGPEQLIARLPATRLGTRLTQLGLRW
jgi:NAD(P)-dependent dehydrogenase (short-subunit alcohol dehydrogenase family)